MQISFMLLFSDQTSGRGKRLQGETASGGRTPAPLWKKARIQQRTVSLFASASLIIQIQEVNHKTILDLSFKQLVANLGYLWPCKIQLPT